MFVVGCVTEETFSYQKCMSCSILHTKQANKERMKERKARKEETHAHNHMQMSKVTLKILALTQKSCKEQVHTLKTVIFQTGISMLSSVLSVNHHNKFG